MCSFVNIVVLKSKDGCRIITTPTSLMNMDSSVSLIIRLKILQDYSTSQELLQRDNIDLTELQQYALDAAHFSTDLPELEFAVSSHVTSHDVL